MHGFFHFFALSAHMALKRLAYFLKNYMQASKLVKDLSLQMGDNNICYNYILHDTSMWPPCV